MPFNSDYHVEQAATGDVTLDKNTDLLTAIIAAPATVTLPLAADCKGEKAKKTVINDTTSSSTLSFVAADSDTIVGITGSGAGDGAVLESDGYSKWFIVRGSSGVGATVAESELVLADNTTKDATSSIHGFMPKLTPGVATANQPVTLGPTKNLDTLALDALTGNDASFGVSGLAAAQGGAIAVTGGTSSTAANAGGAVDVLGGAGGATGVGGAVSLKGGAGLGGAVGGAAVVAAGAGQGTGNGAIASVTGGASGAGATGNGGVAKVTGGASLATDGGGGSVLITPGAKAGSGFAGSIILNSTQGIWQPQPAPKADAGDAAQTLTMAEMLAGIVSATPAQARAVTTPTGTEMDAGLNTADLVANTGFDFSVQNQAAFAATDDILTLTAGASGVTVTGSAVISPGSTARFRAVRTGATTWIIYKIAG